MTETHRMPILVEIGPFYFQKAVTFLYLQLGTVGCGRSSRLDRLDAADGTRLRCFRSQRDGFVEEFPLHQQVAHVVAGYTRDIFRHGLIGIYVVANVAVRIGLNVEPSKFFRGFGIDPRLAQAVSDE